MLLAKVYDKISAGIRREIPAHSCFLSQREQELAKRLFPGETGLLFFGGYGDAQRKMLCYLPEYMEEDFLLEEGGPVVYVRGAFFEGDSLTHRDILGSLMGAGVAREAVGDISVEVGKCHFFVTEEIAPFVISSLVSAGRTHLHLTAMAPKEAEIPKPKTVEIKDTLASLRLDGVISSGFRVSRGQAAQAVQGGRVTVNGIPTMKADKPIEPGDEIALRGMGKIRLAEIGSMSKKGRTFVTIEKFV